MACKCTGWAEEACGFWCGWLSSLFSSLWQNTWQKHLKGGRVDLGSWIERIRRSWWLKCGGRRVRQLSHCVCRDEHWCPASVFFLLFSQSRTPGTWWCRLHSRWAFLTPSNFSGNVIWIHPGVCVIRDSSSCQVDNGEGQSRWMRTLCPFGHISVQFGMFSVLKCCCLHGTWD